MINKNKGKWRKVKLYLQGGNNGYYSMDRITLLLWIVVFGTMYVFILASYVIDYIK